MFTEYVRFVRVHWPASFNGQESRPQHNAKQSRVAFHERHKDQEKLISQPEREPNSPPGGGRKRAGVVVVGGLLLSQSYNIES